MPESSTSYLSLERGSLRLRLAGGYEQLRYHLYNGSPGPSFDRGVRVSIQKLPPA
ncbi:MAG: hypothetical protein Kow0073_09160 [Immundisolibacter sp.]